MPQNKVQEFILTPYRGLKSKPMERLVQTSTITAAGAVVHKNVRDDRLKKTKLSIDTSKRSEEIRQDFLAGKMSKDRAETWLKDLGVEPSYLESSIEEKAYSSKFSDETSLIASAREEGINKVSFSKAQEQFSVGESTPRDLPNVEVALPNSFLIPEKKTTIGLDWLITLVIMVGLIGLKDVLFKNNDDH